MSDTQSTDALIEKFEGGHTVQSQAHARAVIIVGLSWSLYQLWIASPFPFMWGFGIITDLPARGIHLAFGLLLGFLMFPLAVERGWRVPWIAAGLGVLAFAICCYVWLFYDGIILRSGILLTWTVDIGGRDVIVPIEALLAGVGVLLLLEATRRSVGLPLVIVCVVFLLYSIFGQSMPDVIAHKGVSPTRLVGYQWLGSEAVFGIPIGVSVSYVYLFVLFGAFMDRAGAGRFFVDLAFALVGRYRGGPAKAAIMASGFTGMISGSSIANTVTTGAFTIPMMKKMGFPASKAGAIEVASSTNGQIMPPIMGASAFIMAEFIGISYYDVIVHAAVPAFLSYGALFYIAHLEALKLGLHGVPKERLARARAVLATGWHYLIPIVLLIYLLLVERWSPGTAVFYSIGLMGVIMLWQCVLAARESGDGAGRGLWNGVLLIGDAMVSGAKSMAGVTAAVGAAGIIVGAVSATGLNNAMLGVIEALSQGNFYMLLFLTAVVCIILGMGLPTTANYIVVASLMANVLVELGGASGVVIPLIAVHLFVLYYGLMADSTPPVCLAAFAASAISGANPMSTGVQSFLYDIRTAVLPVVFIFNPALLLIGIESIWHGVMVISMGAVAILAFSALTQNWFIIRLNWPERIGLVVVIVALFRPGLFMDRIDPPYTTITMEQAMAGETLPSERAIRLHVTRETNYGDRFKLFTLSGDPSAPSSLPFDERAGLAISQDAEGRFVVDNIGFMGAAETAGVMFGDILTAVDLEVSETRAKEWIYVPGLGLLFLLILSQRARYRKLEKVEAT